MATTPDSLQKQGRAVARRAKGAANKMRNDAAPVIRRVSGQVWEGIEQGLERIDDAARKVQAVSMNAADSIVTYTREKPVRALAIAAASGALLHAAVKKFKPSRDRQAPARHR